jgi:hypothetical protein
MMCHANNLGDPARRESRRRCCDKALRFEVVRFVNLIALAVAAIMTSSARRSSSSLYPGQHARHARRRPGATACRLNAALVELSGEPAQRRDASLPQLGYDYDRRQVSRASLRASLQSGRADGSGGIISPAATIAAQPHAAGLGSALVLRDIALSDIDPVLARSLVVSPGQNPFRYGTGFQGQNSPTLV